MSTSRIHVMFVVPDLHIGGAERHLATLAPRLNRNQFRPSVICIGDEGELFDTVCRAGVEASALNLGGKKNAFRALLGLISRFRNDRPDVVIVRGFNAEVLGRIAARAAGVRHTIVWVHGFDFEHEHRSRLRNLLNLLLLRGTSSHFGVAESQRSYLTDGLQCPSDKVQIIHNGVELSQFDSRTDRDVLAEFGIDAGAPVVGIVAVLRPEKDHTTLFEAAQIVVNDFPDLRVLVVGDGVARKELESLALKLDLANCVHFAGARNDIPRILRALNVFALCSTKETLPIAILEAMACARPVVSTDVGGVSEMVAHGITGYLVPPRDPRQFAARLTHLLSSPALAHQMGLAGRRRIETDFTLDRSVKLTEAAITDIVYGRT